MSDRTLEMFADADPRRANPSRSDAGGREAAGPDEALLRLLEALDRSGYQFTTVTPATQARVLSRPDKQRARDVRDVFGWSLPFGSGVLEPAIEEAARNAGVLEETGDGWRSTLRATRVHGLLFLHSAYPTESVDSVFLGPDSQKLADFTARELRGGPPVRRIVDLGAGAGVGGIVAGKLWPAARVTLTDINPAALRLARVNARHAGVAAEVVFSDAFAAVEGSVDLALSNPPFMADGAHRTYRDGGDGLGARLPLEWALQSAQRLEPGGRFLLYSGAAIVDGRDGLREALTAQLPRGCDLRYREVDPDIFGEELEQPAYESVERIAAVEAVVTRRAG